MSIAAKLGAMRCVPTVQMCVGHSYHSFTFLDSYMILSWVMKCAIISDRGSKHLALRRALETSVGDVGDMAFGLPSIVQDRVATGRITLSRQMTVLLESTTRTGTKLTKKVHWEKRMPVDLFNPCETICQHIEERYLNVKGVNRLLFSSLPNNSGLQVVLLDELLSTGVCQ